MGVPCHGCSAPIERRRRSPALRAPRHGLNDRSLDAATGSTGPGGLTSRVDERVGRFDELFSQLVRDGVQGASRAPSRASGPSLEVVAII